MRTDKALVNFVRLYDAIKELVGTELVPERSEDWLLHGEDVNKIISLLLYNKDLVEDIARELTNRGMNPR